jgi:hypothetical protein
MYHWYAVIIEEPCFPRHILAGQVDVVDLRSAHSNIASTQSIDHSPEYILCALT